MSDKLEQRAECFSKDLKIFVKTNSKVDLDLIAIDFINGILSNEYILKIIRESQKIGYIAGAKSERAEVIGKIREWVIEQCSDSKLNYSRTIKEKDLLAELKKIEEE